MYKNTFSKFNLILLAITMVLIFFSLFFLSNKNTFAQEEEILVQEPEEECLIDADIGNGFEMGKIPIGETVDYTELYIREIIRNLNIMITNTEKAANTAYNENSEDDLYDLFGTYNIVCQDCETEPCECEYDADGECTHCSCECMDCECGANSFDCRCQNASCTCSEPDKGKSTSCGCDCKCACDGSDCIIGSCNCLVKCSNCQANSEEFCVCDYECTGSCDKPLCELLCKVTSGVNIIQNAYKKIVIANNNIAHLVDVEGKITLCNCPGVYLGFVGSEIEIPEQLNRWKITYAFTNSRNKLENCLMGYARVLESQRTTATLLSCLVALDRINLANLLVVPGFNKFASKSEELCFEKLAPDSSDVCYPYNSKAFLTDDEIDACKQNKDGNACHETVKDLMYNFSCCIGGN